MGHAISIRLPDEIAERLSDIAEAIDRPESFHIQKAIEADLEDLETAYDRLNDPDDPVLSVEEMRKELGR